MEYEGDGDDSCYCFARYDTNRLGKGAERVGNRKTSREHPNYSIVEIGQNTEKSSAGLVGLIVTQTQVKEHQLTLEWKTSNYYY